MAMIAGTAYCFKSFPMLSVPNAVGVFCAVLLYTYFFLPGAKVRIFRQKVRYLKNVSYFCTQIE